MDSARKNVDAATQGEEHMTDYERGYEQGKADATKGVETGGVPPLRQWVGLTKAEAKEISLANRPYVIDMIAALEARLKEKNT